MRIVLDFAENNEKEKTALRRRSGTERDRNQMAVRHMETSANRIAEKKTRQANFELLRIVAMLMVITMHFLSHTGALPDAGSYANVLNGAAMGNAARQGMEAVGCFLRGREILGVFVESFCIVAVNVYVLISGYFLCEKTFSIKRLVRLLAQILFYTILIPVILVCIGVMPASEGLNLYHLWNCIFPVQSGHYWFVTAYVVMLLFSPVLNAAVKTLSRRQLKTTLYLLFLFFCVGKSVSIVYFASDKFGYDFGWFMFLYLTAAYLRNYGSVFFSGGKRCAGLYVASCLAVALTTFASLWICAGTGALEYYASVPFHYNFVFALIGALALFGCFRRLRLRDGMLTRMILRIAPATFGVYLLHEHVDISLRWTGWLVGSVSEQLIGYLIQMTESVLVVFVVGVCIDLLRAALFRYVERKAVQTGVGRRIADFLEEKDSLLRG